MNEFNTCNTLTNTALYGLKDLGLSILVLYSCKVRLRTASQAMQKSYHSHVQSKSQMNLRKISALVSLNFLVPEFLFQWMTYIIRKAAILPLNRFLSFFLFLFLSYYHYSQTVIRKATSQAAP